MFEGHRGTLVYKRNETNLDLKNKNKRLNDLLKKSEKILSYDNLIIKKNLKSEYKTKDKVHPKFWVIVEKYEFMFDEEPKGMDLEEDHPLAVKKVFVSKDEEILDKKKKDSKEKYLMTIPLVVNVFLTEKEAQAHLRENKYENVEVKEIFPIANKEMAQVIKTFLSLGEDTGEECIFEDAKNYKEIKPFFESTDEKEKKFREKIANLEKEKKELVQKIEKIKSEIIGI